jgi:DNA modification methylase
MEIHNGDCLEKMKDISDNSIDLIFCDLPYGQTSCKWDTCIDLDIFWEQIKRIRKKGCPMFFTTTTRFGVNLINSNPKEFRYDLVWAKSATTGFLLSKKMPLRKHEMVYVFYDKLPLYDISSHTASLLKDGTKQQEDSCYGKLDKNEYKNKYDKPTEAKKYDPPLPTSVITFTKKEKEKDYRCIGGVYGNEVIMHNNGGKGLTYDPPLPTSLVEIKSSRGKHSTEKPVDLINWILKYYSKEGDVVLDPTMGSGSTGIACNQMKRKFIGIEYDRDIYLKAEDRLKKEWGLKMSD